MKLLHRVYWFCIIAMSLPVLTSCSAERQQKLGELASNRSQWDAYSIKNYRYTLEVSSAWFRTLPTPVRIEVQNGIVASITRDDRQAIRSADFSKYDTIEKVFSVAESRLNENAPENDSVDYDPTFNYPVAIKYDDNNGVDEESRLDITNFEVLDRP